MSARKPEFYDGYEQWKRWDETFSFSPDQSDYYQGECRDVKIKHAHVLEIGFGAGSFLAWARTQGAIVAGTEINPNLCQAARREGIELLPPDIAGVAMDYAGKFDTVAAFDIFEHFTLAEIVDYLSTTETILKPGGHLILRFPNGQSPFGLASQHGDPTHKVALSLAKIGPLLQATNFRVVRYGSPYRTRGRGLKQRAVRTLRYLAQDMLDGILNSIYAQNIPWAPVVTLVLQREPKTFMDKERT